MKTFVVWFKRDLRWVDHAPLVHACAYGRVIALWVYEPEQWAQPDTAAQHLAFASECLSELDAWCVERSGALLRIHANMIDALMRLREAIGNFTLVSHEETGNSWSYERDKSVKRWCRDHQIEWREFPNNAVVRKLDSRDRWTHHWNRRMSDAPLDEPTTIGWHVLPFASVGEISASALGLTDSDKPNRMMGARSVALGLLSSFLMERGQHYRSEMSSPLTATISCSRISPHLAWGTLSIRECVYALLGRRDELRSLPREMQPPGFLSSIKSFEGRLHWHCHFIQKLEDEPEIEFRNVHRGYDGLRHEVESASALEPEQRVRFHAWCDGKTGFPFVDACMRSLRATGWINFRMRAMLMSFASYNVWLHWRLTGLHLARQFIDFEPGIHWSQCQMQSGVTGINAARIYNPLKQSIDQDPTGEFIRRWVPELASLDSDSIHAPWLYGIDVASLGYVPPVVDHIASMREAKLKVYAQRRDPSVRAQAKRVYEKHGSRNPNREGRSTKSRKADDAKLRSALGQQSELNFD
jgi:deoxyribodipyrimidine photo-lyase